MSWVPTWDGVAEAWFWLGETAKADQLYRDWLADDPQWGFGWIGWTCGYMPPSGKGVLTDYQRAEKLLRQGYAVTGVRDRDALADWLRLLPEFRRGDRADQFVLSATEFVHTNQPVATPECPKNCIEPAERSWR